MTERDIGRSNKTLQVWVKHFEDLADDYATIDKFDPTGELEYYVDFGSMYSNKVYKNLKCAENYLTKIGYERVAE